MFIMEVIFHSHILEKKTKLFSSFSFYIETNSTLAKPANNFNFFISLSFSFTIFSFNVLSPSSSKTNYAIYLLFNPIMLICKSSEISN